MHHRITFNATVLRASHRQSDRFSVTAYFLLIWSLLYALPHLYWGLGGPEAHAVYKPSASQQDTWEAAHLFAFTLITFAGTLGFLLQGAKDNRIVRMLLLFLIGGGAAIAMAHGLYGIAFRAASVAGLTDVEGVPFDAGQHGWVLWDLLAIEPWFLVQGILLGLLGYFAQASAQDRKRWVIAVSIPFAFFVSTAALSLKVA